MSREVSPSIRVMDIFDYIEYRLDGIANLIEGKNPGAPRGFAFSGAKVGVVQEDQGEDEILVDDKIRRT